MQTPHLIYFADPMCSWCYGFSPVIADIRKTFGAALPIQLIMGGLRPGTDTPMTDEAKASLAGHWTHVTEASGLPFDPAVLETPGFLYDTDPAARAVVWVRRQDPELALTFLGDLQAAFYAENQNITDPLVLAALITRHGLNGESFLAAFDTEDLKHETWRDYGTSQKAGVTGFPTLIAGPTEAGAYGVVTRGFQPGAAVVPMLEAWLSGPLN
ncbi:MAG: DsbA family protein [Pseudomonadota bacterium]